MTDNETGPPMASRPETSPPPSAFVAANGTPTMTKAERAELMSLARKQAKVRKDQVDALAAERKAQAEAALSARFGVEDDFFKDLTAQAQSAIADLDRQLEQRWVDSGRPPSFRPKIDWGLRSRGENADAGRRAELRIAARTRIDADAKQVKSDIEAQSVQIQTELVHDGLTSAAAHAFLEQMVSSSQLVELMPVLGVDDIQEAGREANAERRRRMDTHTAAMYRLGYRS